MTPKTSLYLFQTLCMSMLATAAPLTSIPSISNSVTTGINSVNFNCSGTTATSKAAPTSSITSSSSLFCSGSYIGSSYSTLPGTFDIILPYTVTQFGIDLIAGSPTQGFTITTKLGGSAVDSGSFSLASASTFFGYQGSSFNEVLLTMTTATGSHSFFALDFKLPADVSSSTPEPATLSLVLPFLAGAAAVALARRRRQQRG